ncbi:MAG: 3-hydroxybutyrate dehydrogenase [Xanthomonadales bacterium]|nr:3-hydroxybutyrate dehydrogenase [Xanthomonadales bacterium]
MSLTGKRALVTGSTSGIGLGIARALADQGASLMLNGLGEQSVIEGIRQEIRDRSGTPVHFSPANMANPGEIEQMIQQAAEAMGGLDILVNNAGIQFVSPVDEFPVEKWDQIIAINLSASFHTIRTAVPIMKQQGWGRIINIASAHALVASPCKAAYVAAKHGIAGLTKVVALETAPHGITVNAIAPGYVETPLVTGQIADTARARGMSEEEVLKDVIQAVQHTGRLIEVSEVAELAVFLCSDAAASITGSVQSIDGGWTAC